MDIFRSVLGIIYRCVDGSLGEMFVMGGTLALTGYFTCIATYEKYYLRFKINAYPKTGIGIQAGSRFHYCASLLV